MTARSDVFKIYLNNLGRIPDPSGWEGYTNFLNSGGTAGNIASFMQQSGEYANTDQVIANAYRTFLGREPSQTEINNQKASGSPTHIIVKAIRDSQEAQEFAGGLNSYINTYASVEPGMQALKNDTNSFESPYHAALYHWNVAGKNENRVIPGIPKIVLNADGSMALADRKWFSNNAYNNYVNAITRFNTASKGSGQYMALLNATLESFKDLVTENDFKVSAKNSIDAFYLKNKAPDAWDANSLMVQPPGGGFDVDYYAKKKPAAVTEYWNKVSSGDLDFIARYGSSDPDLYLRQDYTNVGRHEGIRGYKPFKDESVEQYAEKLTDAERQQYRDQVLGITGLPGQEKLVLSAPKYDDEGKLLNPEEIDTLLERQFANVLTSTELKKEKQLGALAQDVLRTSINELKQAKAKEANLSFVKSLPGYNEITEINTTLANSVLGDSGIGGILSMLGGRTAYKNSLEKDISQITGVSSNSTLYSWQKWFEDTLTKKYQEYEYAANEYSPEDLKILQGQAKAEIASYEKEVATGNTSIEKPVYLKALEEQKAKGISLDINNVDDFKKILVEADIASQKEFMDSFINKYLKPRFDQSKSMDEFISYLDVKEEEQNIFQSQTTVNKLKQIADLRSKGFLDLITQSENAVKNFDTAFYLDPLANTTKEISTAKQAQYAQQKETVAADFENAKNDVAGPDGINWALEAYRFGYEKTYKTDPAIFARLHYQVKGRFATTDAKGESFIFDPAEDILPYEELNKKIQSFGAEMALRKELYGDASFMQFVTPEEYADALLKSVDPAQNKEEWKKILEQLGLDYTEDLSQVKDYLIESFRTEEAKQIRENIKYLNEKQEELTQKNLGVSYIEREEDKKEDATGQTGLYILFKNAGYGGTEDEFYTDFMPDVDRSEQELISKTMSKEGLKFDLGDMEDPFSALSNLSGLFGADETNLEDEEDSEKESSKTTPSYFNIFGEDSEEELPQKSKAAQSFLGEFTSMFSGFK
jgi:hypothetical protein